MAELMALLKRLEKDAVHVEVLDGQASFGIIVPNSTVLQVLSIILLRTLVLIHPTRDMNLFKAKQSLTR